MSTQSDRVIRLDGRSLDRAGLLAIARGAQVALENDALARVERAVAFLAEQVAREEPIYGVSTGFGSNADKLLGAHHLRDALPEHSRNAKSLHEELQENLIITHAVCVGEPFAPEVVRAMLGIRINTLLRGHSGIRVQTLEAMCAMLNAGIVPVVPQLGSVGASGDLAPLSHLAIVLLGGGEAFFDGLRMPGTDALAKAGLAPLKLALECGRMIAGPYGYLVSKVLHKKETYKNYVGLDSCMANLMRPALYGSYHHITVVGKDQEIAP